MIENKPFNKNLCNKICDLEQIWIFNFWVAYEIPQKRKGRKSNLVTWAVKLGEMKERSVPTMRSQTSHKSTLSTYLSSWYCVALRCACGKGVLYILCGTETMNGVRAIMTSFNHLHTILALTMILFQNSLRMDSTVSSQAWNLLVLLRLPLD